MASPKIAEETLTPAREMPDIRPSTPGLVRLPVTSPPLHPSLPPKPGSPAKPQFQEPIRPATPAAVPVVPPPVVITPPEAAPITKTVPLPGVDEQTAKLEEVRVL